MASQSTIEIKASIYRVGAEEPFEAISLYAFSLQHAVNEFCENLHENGDEYELIADAADRKQVRVLSPHNKELDCDWVFAKAWTQEESNLFASATDPGRA